MNLQELTAIGKDMGLSGVELQNFVKEQQAIEREDREKARQAEREAREAKQRELDTLVLLETAKKEARAAGSADGGTAATTCKSPLPTLQNFEEGKDVMDAFLERFERFALRQKWPEDGWAVSLNS